MTPRQKSALISGGVAAVATFIVWIALGNSPGIALVYALIVGIVAAGLTWWQMRDRA
ncbi:MAG TPA: hypothetical protein VD767_05515 [Thermomicrobiales bacterium]|nr:hypothetical protein [Thermomicrobiales bacterium]